MILVELIFICGVLYKHSARTVKHPRARDVAREAVERPKSEEMRLRGAKKICLGIQCTPFFFEHLFLIFFLAFPLLFVGRKRLIEKRVHCWC
jgi:hypothetical protein